MASKGYSFLAIARRFGVPYWTVLCVADEIDIREGPDRKPGSFCYAASFWRARAMATLDKLPKETTDAVRAAIFEAIHA